MLDTEHIRINNSNKLYAQKSGKQLFGSINLAKRLKKNRSKIICLTAYSKNIAEEIDKYTDLILVGDSLGSVLYNYKTTRKVTLNNMIDHSKSVRQGVKKSLMIGDSENDSEAAKSAGIPMILLEDGYTEKNVNENSHDQLIREFIGIEKIIQKYLR